MNKFNWTLEIKISNLEQYLELMKEILKHDKERGWGATEIQVENDEHDPKMQGLIVSIYCLSGEKLKDYAKMIKKVEEK